MQTRNGGGAGVDEGKPVEFNEARAVSDVNALQTLLEDRYKNKVRRQSTFFEGGRGGVGGQLQDGEMLKTLCVVVSDHGEAPKTEGEPEILREPVEGAGKGAREVVVTG